MSDIVERLRGIYRIPIMDGLGAVGAGEEPDNHDEFVRRFETPPIQKEAADLITALRARVASLEGELAEAHEKIRVTEMYYKARGDLVEEVERDLVEANTALAEAREVVRPFAALFDEIMSMTQTNPDLPGDLEGWALTCTGPDLRRAAAWLAKTEPRNDERPTIAETKAGAEE